MGDGRFESGAFAVAAGDHVIPHDLRRTAILLDRSKDPARFRQGGERSQASNVHDRYLNFTDRQLTDAFQIVIVTHESVKKLFPWCSQAKSVENATAASY